jgi:outer membrane protein assembly factor BamB
MSKAARSIGVARPSVRLAAMFATLSLLGGPGVSTLSIASTIPARPAWLLGPASTRGYVLVAYRGRAATRVAAYNAKARLRWRRDYRVSFSGELTAFDGLVYVPVFKDGIYVLGARDGSLKAHLLRGPGAPNPLVACTPGRAYVTTVRGLTPLVVAFDTTSFRGIWKREFPGRHIFELRAHGRAVDVLVAAGTGECPIRFELVTLDPKDGRKVSVRAASGILAEYQWERLRAPARAQMTRLFVRREDNERHYLPLTPMVRLGQLLVVGRGHETDAMLFGIQADSGRIVWEHKAPGLFGMVLVDDRLVVLSAAPDPGDPHSIKRMDWFDFRTGRLLWSVRLGHAPRAQEERKQR